MKRLVAIISLLSVMVAHADSGITYTFEHEPLTQALRTIEMLSSEDITINFPFRKLEDYTVTTTVTDATALEAVHQVVGFYPIKVSQHGTVIVVQPMIEAEGKVIGRLVDEKGNGVGYASVNILDADSAIVATGVSNEGGDIVIPVNASEPITLKATCIGYHMAERPVAVGDVGDIVMLTNPTVLNTISAKADPRIITTVGAVMRIKVAGTPYAGIGTLDDLLYNLPGFNGITGSTAYYLNGREIVDQNQLAMIRSNDISTIAIDRAPGVEYPADASVVVNITTLRNINDHVYLNVANTTDVRRRISDIPSVDFKMQVRKFTTQLSYRYDYLQSKWDEERQRNVFDDRNNMIWSLLRRRTIATVDKEHRINWSGELQCGKRNRLGLYIYYNKGDGQSSMMGSDHVESTRVGVVRNDVSANKTFSGAFTYDFNNRWLSAHFGQGLLLSKQVLGGIISENVDSALVYTEASTINYVAANTNVDFKVKFPWQMSMSAGWRRSWVNSENTIFLERRVPYNSMSQINPEYMLRCNYMSVDETDNQLYVSLNQRIGNLVIVPGVRWQRVERYIQANMDDYKPTSTENGAFEGVYQGISNDYDREHINLLPSLSIRYANDNTNISLDYQRKITHPAFRMLNSGITYEDSQTWYLSNSQLESAVTDEVRLSGSSSGFSADLGFIHEKSPIADVETVNAYYTDPNLEKWLFQGFHIPVNLCKLNMLVANIAYTAAMGPLTCYGSVGLNMPLGKSDQELTYGDGGSGSGWHGSMNAMETSVKRHPWVNLGLNATYRINKHFSLYGDFKLQTAAKWLIFERTALNRLNLGVNASFCANRLNINLEATDLLAHKDNGALTTSYLGTVSRLASRGDMRGISLCVSYTIFNKPIRTRATRANNDLLHRIE